MTRHVRFPGRHHLLTRFQAGRPCGLSRCSTRRRPWVGVLTAVGFEVAPASHAWRNDWIVEHRIAPVARPHTTGGDELPWPVTHALLVARRPLNT